MKRRSTNNAGASRGHARLIAGRSGKRSKSWEDAPNVQRTPRKRMEARIILESRIDQGSDEDFQAGHLPCFFFWLSRRSKKRLRWSKRRAKTPSTIRCSSISIEPSAIIQSRVRRMQCSIPSPGRMSFESIITSEFSLDNINAALDVDRGYRWPDCAKGWQRLTNCASDAEAFVTSFDGHGGS
jgi:hypothetical protein